MPCTQVKRRLAQKLLARVVEYIGIQ